MALRFASIKTLLGFTVYFVNLRVSSGAGASGDGIVWEVPNQALIDEIYAASDAQPWNYVPNVFTAGVDGHACGYPLSYPDHPPCGPGNWGFLPNSSFCLPGRTDQTPINIDTISAPLPPASSQTDLDGNPPTIEYISSATICQKAKLSNKLSFFEVALSDCTGPLQIRVKGIVYTLAQFHFHTPSEHTVDGIHYVSEVHLVHLNVDVRQAVVIGMNINLGIENEFLRPMLNNMPSDVADKKISGIYDVYRSFANYRNKFWHYKGSLTTPPCLPIVNWYLMKEPITMSAAQVQIMTKALLNNANTQAPEGNSARPLQPVAGRTIYSQD